MGFSPSSLRWSTCWWHYLRMDSHKPANKLALRKLDGAWENGLVFLQGSVSWCILAMNWTSLQISVHNWRKNKICAKKMYFFLSKKPATIKSTRLTNVLVYWSGGWAVRVEFWRLIPNETTNPTTTTPRHSQQRSVINIPHTLGSRQISPAHTHIVASVGVGTQLATGNVGLVDPKLPKSSRRSVLIRCTRVSGRERKKVVLLLEEASEANR